MCIRLEKWHTPNKREWLSVGIVSCTLDKKAVNRSDLLLIAFLDAYLDFSISLAILLFLSFLFATLFKRTKGLRLYDSCQ